MSLPMKWWISVSALRHQSSSFSPCCSHHSRRRGDVADRRVEPDVPVVARAVGNLEAEVRRRPRDVPVAQRLAEEVALPGSWRLRLASARRVCVHSFKKAVQLLDVARTGAWPCGAPAWRRESVLTGIDQVGRAVGRAALVATVAVLVGRLALGAGPFDEPVGQKRAGLGVVELRHLLLARPGRPCAARPRSRRTARDSPGCSCCRSCRTRCRSRRSRATWACCISAISASSLRAFLPGADHDRRAVRVVGADDRCSGARAASGSGPRCRSGCTRPGGPMWMWPLA